jgi:hypothetical protein
MAEQDYLDYLSLPTCLYEKIESNVTELFMELDIRNLKFLICLEVLLV